MAKKRIFIGSALETKDVAAHIARKLADSSVTRATPPMFRSGEPSFRLHNG